MAVDMDFEVKVGAGGEAGAAGGGDDLALADALALAAAETREVGVDGGSAASVVDDHDVAVAAHDGGGRDHAIGGGVDGGAGTNAKI